MVEQLYTNARTGTYKHPSRYAVAAVGIGRGARSGWVELGWRMGRIGATRPHFGGGGTWGQLLEQGGVRAADGSERSNAPSLGGRGYVGSIAEIGRSARSGWVELGWRMGRSRTTNGAGWDVGWVGAGQRMGQVGTSDGSVRNGVPSLRGREHLYSAR